MNLTWIRNKHTVKFGTEYNHVFADQLFGFNQFGRFTVNGTNTATLLDALGTGGAIANRFDTTDATYLLQLGNLQAAYATDEVALFVQDNWKLRPNFTVNAGLRWEGAFNPTPDATNTTMLNQVRGFNFPIGRTTDPSLQIPSQTEPVRTAPRLRVGPDQGRSHGGARLHGHLLRAHARPCSTPARSTTTACPRATCRSSFRWPRPATRTTRSTSSSCSSASTSTGRRSARCPG